MSIAFMHSKYAILVLKSVKNKFVKAVIFNDISGMKKEYTRYTKINGKYIPLSRNQKFYDTFLKNYNGGYYTSSL